MLSPLTIAKDIELFLTALKAVVPPSMLANTVLGSKLAEIEAALNAIASIVHALQALETPALTTPAPTAS